MTRPGLRRWLSIPFSSQARRAREVEDEIEHHVMLRTQRLIEAGTPADTARREAERLFGGDRARESLLSDANQRDTDMHVRELFTSFGDDLRFAARQLLRAPAFTIAAVATIALGVGANATMFGVVDRLLFRPPPFVRAPDRVVLPTLTTGPHGSVARQSQMSFPIFRDLAADPSFQFVATFSPVSLTLGSGSDARELSGIEISPAYFAALGVNPTLGTFFDASTDPARPAERNVVVSDAFFHNGLGGLPTVIGQTLELAGAPYRVIGVAPPRFAGTDQRPVDVWLPAMAGAAGTNEERKSNRQWFSLRVVARLRDGLSLDQAAASATRSVQNGERRDGLSDAMIRKRNTAVELTTALPRDVRGKSAASRVAVLLAAMSVFVLLLAGVNVTNLQLGRAIRRRREVSIRLALGVGRSRLMRQLLTESLALSIVGGMVAIGVVWWGTQLMRRTLLSGFDSSGSPVDGRVLAFVLLLATLLGLVTGLLPALQSLRSDLFSGLRAGRQPDASRGRTRAGLLAAQSALGLMLLVGTGLFVRSLRRVESLPLGLDPASVLVAGLNTSGAELEPAAVDKMIEGLEQAARTLPEVERAALTLSLPFGASSQAPVFLSDQDSVGRGPYADAVGPEYFAALGTPIVGGRDFNTGDRRGTQLVVIVNRTAARRWWPRQSAIGQCVRLLERTAPCSTVIGVAEDARRQSVIEDESPQIFAPADQARAWANPRTLVIRVRGNPAVAAARVQRALQAAVPGLPYVNVTRLSDRVGANMRSWRLGATMFGAFGALAIVLAAIGLYGVLAYDVSQRTREIGVRLALGGPASRVAGMVVGQGMSVSVAGAVVGLCAAMLASSRIEPLLFRTSRLDPVVYVSAAGIVILAALLASWIPAMRASKVDPIVTLQSD